MRLLREGDPKSLEPLCGVGLDHLTAAVDGDPITLLGGQQEDFSAQSLLQGDLVVVEEVGAVPSEVGVLLSDDVFEI